MEGETGIVWIRTHLGPALLEEWGLDGGVDIEYLLLTKRQLQIL